MATFSHRLRVDTSSYKTFPEDTHMSLPERMKFGIFMGPFHRVGENPTLAITRDLELVEWLDYLGFDEAWIGEHHSAGWEIISSPDCRWSPRRPTPSPRSGETVL